MMLVEKEMIITDENKLPILWMSILLALQKSYVLKPSIFSKDSDSDFFHDHISIKKIKEIYPEIVGIVLSLN